MCCPMAWLRGSWSCRVSSWTGRSEQDISAEVHANQRLHHFVDADGVDRVRRWEFDSVDDRRATMLADAATALWLAFRAAARAGADTTALGMALDALERLGV